MLFIYALNFTLIIKNSFVTNINNNNNTIYIIINKIFSSHFMII